jgi:hypothetical protein
MIFTAICAFDYVIHAVHSVMVFGAFLAYDFVFAEFCYVPEFLPFSALIRCFRFMVFCSANLLACEELVKALQRSTLRISDIKPN